MLDVAVNLLQAPFIDGPSRSIVPLLITLPNYQLSPSDPFGKERGNDLAQPLGQNKNVDRL